MLRVAAYCRVSTDFAEQMNSFENQVEIYTDKISKNPNWVLADIYADPAISGTSENRPEFQRMLRDAEKKTFDLLLVKSISRFARNTLVSVETVRHLKSLGIGVIFEKENIDTTVPYSEMMLTILSAFAQEESRSISERVKKGKRMKEARGEIPWNPLYGYAKVDGIPFVIVEHEATVVRRIFNQYAAGKLPHEILDDLNREGIPGPSGGMWVKNSITNVLANERYTGDVLTMKVYCDDHMTHKYKRNQGEMERYLITDHHDAIVSREVFQRAQEIKELRKENTYPYGSFLTCPNCGRKLVRERAGWGCSCGQFYMPKGKLDEAMMKAYDSFDGEVAAWMKGEYVADEKTAEIKAYYPSAESVEYWWFKDMIERISFSRDGKTMTVHWYCGQESEVPTGYNRMWGDISGRMERKRKKEATEIKEKQKTVTKVHRNTVVAKI